MSEQDGAASLVRSDALLESAFLLSNAELAKAIDRAHQSAGSHSDLQKLWAKHLEMLLKIQSTRAAYVRDSNAGGEFRRDSDVNSTALLEGESKCTL